MTRTVNASTLASFESPSSKITHLVSVNLGSTIQRYTSSPIDVSYGATYEASKLWVSIGGVSQTAALENGQLGIIVSTAEGNYASWMQNYNWHNGDVYYYIAAIDDSYQIIGDPILIFKGLLSTWSISEGKSPQIELLADSHWADFERVAGRRTNNNSQQQYYSTDQGMEYAADSIRDLRWGAS